MRAPWKAAAWYRAAETLYVSVEFLGVASSSSLRG